VTSPSFGDLTPFHAKLLAHELSLRKPSDSVEKLATALADAQVDLNPTTSTRRCSRSSHRFRRVRFLPTKSG
jgi:hypothetical protein